MNKLSIKFRVTLWYTMLMIIVVALVLGFMIAISDSVTENNSKNYLIKVITDNIDEIEYDDDDDEPEIDDDFYFFKNGVYCSVYSFDYQFISGQVPNNFYTDTPFVDGDSRIVTSDNERYYVYDKLIIFTEHRNREHKNVWIRGIVSIDENVGVVNSIMKTAFFVLPFFVAVAALGGYVISRWSFEPIKKITFAANEINEGRDLSKRIGLYKNDNDSKKNNNEIYSLAETFDNMFQRLEIAFEAEKQFSSDVSHELRTPVAVILAQCEYTLNSPQTKEEYTDALQVIQRQTHKISQIINRLLTFNRLEQGIEKVILEDTDLSELVQMICEEQIDMSKKNITLAFETDPTITLSVDRSMIARLLTNLIVNAYNYGKENGKIFVRLYQTSTDVILSVADDGIGIALEDQQKIWNRFYQVNPSRTANENGSMGLGLAMAKQIAELHGGQISVESVPEEGSTFFFRLPKKKNKKI